MNKPNAATRKTLLGIGWLAVSLIVMGWSAYSMYIVVCYFKGGRIAGITFSTCFDSAAVIGACYMLKFIQEGRSSTFPRLFVAFCVALSALINSLHASILGEPMIMGLGYAALPVIAAGLFELHVSSDRHKAQARMGKRYPSPLPSFGVAPWAFFTFHTLDKLMDHVYSRVNALSDSDEDVVPRKILKERRRAEYAALSAAGALPATPQTLPATRALREPLPATEPLPVTGPLPGGASFPGDPLPATRDPGDAVGANPGAGPERFSGPGPGAATGDPGAATGRGDTGDATVTVLPSGAKRYMRYCANTKCGREFHASRPEAKCCSSNCRVALTRARKAREEAVS